MLDKPLNKAIITPLLKYMFTNQNNFTATYNIAGQKRATPFTIQSADFWAKERNKPT